jgi:hypothetical protein
LPPVVWYAPVDLLFLGWASGRAATIDSLVTVSLFNTSRNFMRFFSFPAPTSCEPGSPLRCCLRRFSTASMYASISRRFQYFGYGGSLSSRFVKTTRLLSTRLPSGIVSWFAPFVHKLISSIRIECRRWGLGFGLNMTHLTSDGIFKNSAIPIPFELRYIPA